MTNQLRPSVIIVAVVALAAGVLGLRTLASSESDMVPAGQPFVVEADYPLPDEETPVEPVWVRPPQPRNPFVADPASPLAVGTDTGESVPLFLDDESDPGEGADDSGPEGSDQGASAPDDGPAPPLGNAAEAPAPGEILEIEITPDDPNGLAG